MKRTKILLVLLVSFLSITAYSQIPTNQDCLGAIPVCQNYYYQANSYANTGNILNEINNAHSCLYSGEKNDVWYVFTIVQSGNVAFSITPNTSSDDYDWAVYNLTNNPCSAISSNASLEVSCNYSGVRGAFTGANGLGGSQNEPVIPVLAGQTYVLNVSNYSSSQSGYALDFSASSAVIFDNIPPEIDSVFRPIPCGTTTLDFSFTERILCSTISTADLVLFGPGGPYTLSNLYGAACASGGTQENFYSVDVTPPITTSGIFYLKLDATLAGSVTDLCGNIAPTDSLVFAIQNITSSTTLVSEDLCYNCLGQVNSSGGNGSVPYTYQWSTTPVQNTPMATNLCGGSTYYVTITDARGCNIIDSMFVNGTSIEISTNVESEDYCGDTVGKISVNIIGGTAPFTYQWNTNPIQTTDTAFNLVGNQWYYVTVTDSDGCIDTDSAYINIVDGPTITITNTNISSGGIGGWASTNTSGGTAPYTYQWSSSPAQTSDSLLNVGGGNYIVTVTDDNGCTDTTHVYITQANLVLNIQGTNEDCSMGNGNATVFVTDALGTIYYIWDTGDTTDIINGLSAGTYTVTVTDTANIPVTADVTIGNNPGPTALFSAVPPMKTNIDPTIQFINNSNGANLYYWEFGDGLTSTDIHPLHTYSRLPMIYDVTLYATSSVGCIDSITKSVEIREEFTLFMPNAFTPNGDGLNEIVMPQLKEGTYVEGTFEFKIFDRWGQLIFVSKDPKIGWDGTVNKKDSQNETYVYTITVQEKGGIIKEFTGKITLLR